MWVVARAKTDGDAGPLSQELGRFTYSVDEGPSRERRNPNWGHLDRDRLGMDVVVSLEGERSQPAADIAQDKAVEGGGKENENECLLGNVSQ